VDLPSALLLLEHRHVCVTSRLVPVPVAQSRRC
jgi:hypothetical protein